MARSGCIYGPSGSWKTTAGKHFAHYIAETTGKATYLFSSDGGGWEACQPEIDAGMVLPYRCEANVLPMVLARKISQGFWPENPTEYQPERINLVPMDFERVGGIIVEGWTSLSSMLMRYCSDKGIQAGDKEYTGLFKLPIHIEGQLKDEKFGPSTQNHYGMVQNQLNGITMNFTSLPVRYVLFTALEGKGEEDDRTPTYGPAIAGKKATPQAPSWVGDCIHAQDYSVPRKVKAPDPVTGQLTEQQIVDVKCRYYFVKHPDPVTGIAYPAKPRITPEKVGALRSLYPGGYFEPTPEKGFDEYLKACDRFSAEQSASDALKNWRERMDAKLGRGLSTAIPINVAQGAKKS